MPRRIPTETVDVRTLRADWGAIVGRVKRGASRVIVTNHRNEVLFLGSMADLAELQKHRTNGRKHS